jgi:hypothetical protein
MKRSIKLITLVIAISICTACSSNMIIDGKKYEPYGLINEKDVRSNDIKYEPCWGNIIWGSILIETIVGPIYFFGFDMFQPVGKNK